MEQLMLGTIRSKHINYMLGTIKQTYLNKDNYFLKTYLKKDNHLNHFIFNLFTLTDQNTTKIKKLLKSIKNNLNKQQNQNQNKTNINNTIRTTLNHFIFNLFNRTYTNITNTKKFLKSSKNNLNKEPSATALYFYNNLTTDTTCVRHYNKLAPESTTFKLAPGVSTRD